jgi:hypothetical protein
VPASASGTGSPRRPTMARRVDGTSALFASRSSRAKRIERHSSSGATPRSPRRLRAGSARARIERSEQVDHLVR